MPLLYEYNPDSPKDVAVALACDLKKRRLEKGLTRNALSAISGVPAATIAKFEQKSTISLQAFISIAASLGYTEKVKSILSEPLFSTMEELKEINRNKNRKRGSK